MKTIRTTLILLFILSFISCQEDGIYGLFDDHNVDSELNFGAATTHNFIGRVIDINFNPISNAIVKIGASTAETDVNGVFLINEATVYENFAYITANKSGYLQGSTSMIPNSGTNKLTIMLLDNTPVRTINSGVVETITLSNGASITLNGDYVDTTGSSYSGTVDVFIHNISPSAKKVENLITGLPYGERVDGIANYLESFGTIAIELRDNTGNLLDLAEDSTAEISIPIATALQSSAPNTIPLWYFDKENGIWKEAEDEEEATKQGEKYVGIINHLSFWSCSNRSSVHIVQLKLTDNTDTAISNQRVDLSYNISGYPYHSITNYSNSEGLIRFLAPTKSSSLIVYNHDICGDNVIHTKELISTTANQEATIVISDNDLINEHIVGSFVTCSDDIVELGYLTLELGSEVFYDPIYQGKYDMNILSCTNSEGFQVKAIDYLNVQEFGTINYFFVNPTTYIGELKLCNTVDEIIQFTIDDGSEKVLITNNIYAKFKPLNTAYNAPSLTIFEQNINSRFNLFGLLNDSPYIGVYDNYEIGSLTDRGMNIGQSIDVSDINNNISYNFVLLGHIGEYFDMHFSGNYEDTSGNSHSIVGVIHILRDE